jgi:hypothetical protein
VLVSVESASDDVRVLKVVSSMRLVLACCVDTESLVIEWLNAVDVNSVFKSVVSLFVVVIVWVDVLGKVVS